MALYILIPFLLLLPSATWALTNWRYKAEIGQDAGKDVPSAPFSIPLLGHTVSFAKGSNALADILRQFSTPEKAVRFYGLGFNFILLSGPNLIRTALTHATHFDWNKISAPMFAGMFNGSQLVVDALLADDSGIGAKPYPGSDVHPGRRLMRNQILFFGDLFSKKSAEVLLERFTENIQKWCAKSDIGDEWVQKDDLYTFVREILFSCNVDAVFGPSLRELNSRLDEDFWEYDDNISFLATPMPAWMRPNAAKARNRCHAAMINWRKNALKNSEGVGIDEDAAWDPAWGLAAIRRRNKLLDATEGLFDERNRGSIDLALLWSLTSNVIPASFWYLFEVLASDGLIDRTLKEVTPNIPPSPKSASSINSTSLFASPLLQSIYAETLRLHVVTLITRTVKKTHSVSHYTLPKDQNIIVSSDIEQRSSQWDVDSHSAQDFYPDRFLVKEKEDGKEEPKFSLDGRQGQWIPFGMGEHMCPGRHFAKQEMIMNFSLLVSFFEFELLTPKGWRPENDYERYGFGSVQAKEKVPFRVRRRKAA